MHDLQRTIVGLLMTSFVLCLPGASAAGPGVDLDARVSIDAHADLDDATAAARQAAADAATAADMLRADVESHAHAAAAGAEARASAEAAAGEAEARGALASIGAALAMLGELASGFFARVDIGARLG